MSFTRTLFLTVFAFLASTTLQTLFAQSCSGNLLHDASGYYGGFESGSQSIAAGRGFTDLQVGSRHGAYQVIHEANKPWEDVEGGGYLPLSVRSGDFMMLIHTSNARLWYKAIAVVPGQILDFCASIASAKEKPVNGFEYNPKAFQTIICSLL